LHPRATGATKSPAQAKRAQPRKPTRRRADRRAPTPVLEVDDEAPATSRSSEISARTPTTARAKVERLVDSLQRMVDLVSSAENVGEGVPIGAQLAVLRAMVAPLRLLGTFTGEIGASESVVASSPFYRRVRAIIVDALRPHPDAARAVITALERLERGGVDLESAAE
jgi:hypothetical protein